jgi:hypothetical protein
MFELLEPPATAEPNALLDEVRSASRSETRAVAQRLTAIWQLYRVRLRQSGGHETWAADTWNAVAGEVAATLNVSLGFASSQVRFARAMHERLPLVGMVLAAGDIDYRLFQTIVYRTDLITDPDTLAVVDGQLAGRAPRWTSLSLGKASREVDRIVAQADEEAVRRRRERVEEREVLITDCGDGLASVYGTVDAIFGHAFDKRLNALAATVCDADPRTVAQRRSDAFGALAAGADRLGCHCGNAECPAGGKAAAVPVVLHVIAQQATVDGKADTPAYLVRAVPGFDLPGAGLRSASDVLRSRPHHSARRGWADPCLEFEVPVPHASSAQDVLGMARSTVARRHGDLDAARWPDLCHHPGQCPVVSELVRAHWRSAAAGSADRGPLR